MISFVQGSIIISISHLDRDENNDCNRSRHQFLSSIENDFDFNESLVTRLFLENKETLRNLSRRTRENGQFSMKFSFFLCVASFEYCWTRWRFSWVVRSRSVNSKISFLIRCRVARICSTVSTLFLSSSKRKISPRRKNKIFLFTFFFQNFFSIQLENWSQCFRRILKDLSMRKFSRNRALQN